MQLVCNALASTNRRPYNYTESALFISWIGESHPTVRDSKFMYGLGNVTKNLSEGSLCFGRNSLWHKKAKVKFNKLISFASVFSSFIICALQQVLLAGTNQRGAVGCNMYHARNIRSSYKTIRKHKNLNRTDH
jgi:hypothetical protein